MRRPALLFALMIVAKTAQAGPPYQTDDPDPVPYKHFEMYAFELSDGSSADGTTLFAPAYEVNYGVVPGVQLHLVVPVATFLPPDGSPVHHGIGDTELGIKVRFLKENKYLPEIGIFPFFELPSGDADKGLGVGRTWYHIPLWLQKSWGPAGAQWTSYGGGGETILPQEGYRNFPYAGWLIQRQICKKLTLGPELFGHGPVTLDTVRSTTMLDMGGEYELKEGFDLLFAAGKAIYGHPETYTYLALYWTWGPTGAADPDSATKSKKVLSTLTRRLH